VDPGPISFTLLYRFTFTRIVYFHAYYYLLPLDTLNPLFTANRWDWQPHRKFGAKFLVVLCACSTLLLVQSKALDEAPYKLSGAVAKLAGITFWSLAFSYWFDKPWFHNWGKTCCCAHHTFLLGFPTGCYLHAINSPDRVVQTAYWRDQRARRPHRRCHHWKTTTPSRYGGWPRSAIGPRSEHRHWACWSAAVTPVGAPPAPPCLSAGSLRPRPSSTRRPATEPLPHTSHEATP
jgi:hypothetical protein